VSALQCTADILVIFEENCFKNVLVSQECHTIYDEKRKSKILEIISDEYCRKILSITMKEHKSVIEISKETMIPISTLYRRVQMLHDEKLMRISGTLNEDGKKSFLYKSKIKSISTFFNGDFIEIEVVPNNIEKL